MLDTPDAPIPAHYQILEPKADVARALKQSDKPQGELREWILQRLQSQGFSWNFFPPDAQLVRHDDERSFGPSSKKTLIAQGNFETFDPHGMPWIGGICCLFTGDGEQIRKGEKTFGSVPEFETWMRQWYPRIDQISGAVGIPPIGCKQLYYLCEDTLWGRRIEGWTKQTGPCVLPAEEVAAVLHDVHETQGHPAIVRWHRRMGFRGNINVIYSSDIESELATIFRVYQRHYTPRRREDRIKPDEVDDVKVLLMGSTSALLDILGLKEGTLAMPFSYFHDMSALPQNPFSRRGHFTLGFLPHWSDEGNTRIKPIDAVPHRGNHSSIAPDVPWLAANHYFSSKKPFQQLERPIRMIEEYFRKDLAAIYSNNDEAIT